MGAPASGSHDWRWGEDPDPAGLWRIAPLEAAGARAVFSSRAGGVSPAPWDTLNLGASVGDEPARVRVNRERFARAAGFDPTRTAHCHQVHGTTVLRVTQPGPAGTADGLCTDRPGLVLTIGVADCAAVYVFDPLGPAVGLVHAGWRGTVGDAVGVLLRTMHQAWGSRPERMLAAVSPCIGPCCYEVDEPVTGPLRRAAPWAAEVLEDPAAPRTRLDVARANVLRLVDGGLRSERIHTAGLCTACHPRVLFSHRGSGGRTGRMQAAIWLPA